MSLVDLHIHSTASDGSMSPADIVHMAAGQGMKVIALSDHDTVAGVHEALEAAQAFPDLRVIPSVELSTYAPGSEVHVLGYFVDYESREFTRRLSVMKDGRRDRARAIIAKLSSLGLPIDFQRVDEIAAGSIGRPHIAQAMVEKGYVESVSLAFEKYLARGLPGYVEWKKICPAEAVNLVLESGGLPVLAHPFTVENAEARIVELKAKGLVGLEAYYSCYAEEDIDRLLAIADSNDLIATGGSDFHGPDSAAGSALGVPDVPLEAAERLIALARSRGLKVAD